MKTRNNLSALLCLTLVVLLVTLKSSTEASNSRPGNTPGFENKWRRPSGKQRSDGTKMIQSECDDDDYNEDGEYEDDDRSSKSGSEILKRNYDQFHSNGSNIAITHITTNTTNAGISNAGDNIKQVQKLRKRIPKMIEPKKMSSSVTTHPLTGSPSNFTDKATSSSSPENNLTNMQAFHKRPRISAKSGFSGFVASHVVPHASTNQPLAYTTGGQKTSSLDVSQLDIFKQKLKARSRANSDVDELSVANMQTSTESSSELFGHDERDHHPQSHQPNSSTRIFSSSETGELPNGGYSTPVQERKVQIAPSSAGSIYGGGGSVYGSGGSVYGSTTGTPERPLERSPTLLKQSFGLSHPASKREYSNESSILFPAGFSRPTPPSSIKSVDTTASDVSFNSGGVGVSDFSDMAFVPNFARFGSASIGGAGAFSLTGNLYGFNQQSLFHFTNPGTPVTTSAAGAGAEMMPPSFMDQMNLLSLTRPSDEIESPGGRVYEIGSPFSFDLSDDLDEEKMTMVDGDGDGESYDVMGSSFADYLDEEIKSTSGTHPLFFMLPGTGSPLESPELSEEERLRWEYEPWLTRDLEGVPLTSEFEGLSEFSLLPFRSSEDLPNPEDSLADRGFWPESVKPIRDYGDFPESGSVLTSVSRLASALKQKEEPSLMESYLERMDQAERKRLEKIAKKALRSTTKSEASSSSSSSSSSTAYSRQYKTLTTYLQNCSTYNNNEKNPPAYYAVEEEWIPLILGQKCIPFGEYCQLARADPSIGSHWSIKRARRFLSALIPCIFYNAHMEEVALDFIDDFVVPFVIPADLQRRRNSLSAGDLNDEISDEFAKMCAAIIKDLATPTLLEKLLTVGSQDLMTAEGVEMLFKRLHDQMIVFRVPEPYESKDLEEPVQPASNASEEEKRAFDKKRTEYRTAQIKEIAQKAYEDSKRSARIVQKDRSFSHLNLLVKHFPSAVTSPVSNWTCESLLVIPPDSEDLKSKKDKNDEMDEDEELTQVHPNQDFFDALFFSPFLVAFQTTNTPSIKQYVEGPLTAFLMNRLQKFRDPQGKETAVLHRLLYSVNIYIRLTRFNSVSNVPPPIIQYRRYLIAALVHKFLRALDQEQNKLVSRCFSMRLHSLYEALLVYQVAGSTSESERLTQLSKYLNSIGLYDFEAFLIFITYSPIKWQHLDKAFNEFYERFDPEKAIPPSEKSSKRPTEKQAKKMEYFKNARLTILMLREITALVKDVGLVPIYGRNVFTHIPINDHLYSEKERMVMSVIGEDSPPFLGFKDYHAKYEDAIVYTWSLSKAYKDLMAKPGSNCSSVIPSSYNIYAAQILLARRFGISFDSSTINGQFYENFSWPEVIGVVNFALDREAQIITAKAFDPALLLEEKRFKMHKVVDPQMSIYKQWALNRNEATHFIHQLIDLALTAIGQPAKNLINSTLSRDELFKIYETALESTDIQFFSKINGAKAIGLFKDILSEDPKYSELLEKLGYESSSSGTDLAVD